MTQPTDLLSPAEAAIVAGVSVRDIHRAVDERILPDCLYAFEQARAIRTTACVFISFYFGAADSLTSEERRRVIDAAIEDAAKPRESKKSVIKRDFLTIDLSSFRIGVQERLKRLNAAREIVTEDPEILSGTPVVKGTRVPVYGIAASLSSGISMDRVLAAYPSLTEETAALAALYAQANPLRGRPPRRIVPPKGAMIRASRKRPRTTEAA